MATIITNKPHKVAWINYLSTTGATDRKPLYDFVEGCFDLGIWSNMVCWPLRSAQNKATGTTVYSLGGLGSYNGTMSGATPSAVESDGLLVNANDQLVSCSIPVPSAVSMVFVKKTVTAGNFSVFNGTELSIYAPFGADIYFDYKVSNPRHNVNGGFVVGQNAWISCIAGTTGKRTRKNLTLLKEDAIAANASGDITKLVQNGTTGSHKLPFLFLANSEFDSQEASIYSLYKSTLGTGLSLP